MKKYISPEISVELFEYENVFTASSIETTSAGEVALEQMTSGNGEQDALQETMVAIFSM